MRSRLRQQFKSAQVLVRGFFKPLFAFMSFAFLAVLSSTILAAEPTKLVGESVVQPSDYFLQIIMSLVLVLLIIFLSAWMLRRYGRYPGVADGNLKVLGTLTVGQRERILLLQVGKEQILVGVTSSRISTLHQLTENIKVAEPQALGGSFAQRLQEALGQKVQPNKEDLEKSKFHENQQVSRENP